MGLMPGEGEGLLCMKLMDRKRSVANGTDGWEWGRSVVGGTNQWEGGDVCMELMDRKRSVVYGCDRLKMDLLRMRLDGGRRMYGTDEWKGEGMLCVELDRWDGGDVLRMGLDWGGG